jgi:putative SOS response-associated peptidase YedK
VSWKLSCTVLRGPDGSNPVWLLDKRNGKHTQPYFFQLKDESPFAFAGIWDWWQRDGVLITSCAIITTTPNELLTTIHDRMPAMLSTDSQASWLSGDTPAELKQLLVPFPASAMKSFPVSLRVNHAEIDEAQLVEPIELIPAPTTGRLF